MNTALLIGVLYGVTWKLNGNPWSEVALIVALAIGVFAILDILLKVRVEISDLRNRVDEQ